MPTNSRKQKLESLLHREIAVCVQQELKDPRLGFLTIVRVEMTDDLQSVKAFWTCLGDQKQRRLAEQALTHARGFIQGRYADVVATRRLPTLSFHYDDAEFRRESMNLLIKNARSSDTDGGSQPTPAAPEPKAPKPGKTRGRPAL
jgi:ribosome-binding factor A